MNRPIVIAHRGGLEQAPENTIEAFKAAFDSAADGFELDVQLTRCGVLAVRHDLLAPDADVSPWPTLAEVLELAASRRPDMRIVIDIKGAPWTEDGRTRGQALIDRAAPLLQAHPRPDRIVLGSFDWDTLDYARQVLPTFACAYHTMAARWLAGLSESQTSIRDPRDYLSYLETWRQGRGPGFEACSHLDLFRAGGGAIWSCLHRDLTVTAIARARELGLAVWTWTVNTEEDLRRVLALGVDAVTTDRPGAMLRYFDSTRLEDSHD
jgi:glycerophosphoryl diester phosphodiesterase